MTPSELNCLRVVWDDLKKLEKRLEGNTFLYDVDEYKYIRGKIDKCMPNLETLLGPNPAQSLTSEPSSLSLSSSWCPYSGKTRNICQCRHCWQLRLEIEGKNASSLSGPEAEPPQDGGPDSTSKTPVTPDADSRDTTVSGQSVKPRAYVYVAGPYWHPNDRIRELHRAAAKLMAIRLVHEGFFPITPHLNTGEFEDYVHMPESFYHQGDMHLIGSADCIILLQGNEKSRGTQAEIKYAQSIGCPVFKTLEELEDQYAEA